MSWDKSYFKKIYSRDLGHNIVESFLEPLLSEAVTYDRITGDFSSAFLVAASRGFSEFFLSEGKMRLITNGRFSEHDIKAIREGTDPSVILENFIDNELFSNRNIIDTFQKRHIEALVWLLKKNHLEIKVSLLKGSDGHPLPAENIQGMQHQKIGIVSNIEGDKIAFIGGLNESMRAYCGNSEGLQASYSWNQGDIDAIVDLQNVFDKLWNNLSPHSIVLAFPEASKKKLIAKYSTERIPFIPVGKNVGTKVTNKWVHQDIALEKFMEVHNGILEMATGTGKTKTALKIIEKLLSENKISGVVIATKGNDLLDQWYKECISFPFTSSLTFFKHFGKKKQINLFYEFLQHKKPSGLIVSYTNLEKLLVKDKFNLLCDCFLICDEVHNIGSIENVNNLSGKLGTFSWKIGLSATPEREYDEDGNSFIENEIGNVFFEFGLDKAINKRILCEFNYIPLFYELSDDDRNEIKSVYSSHYARIKNGEHVSKSELYTKLANVRKTSKAKLPVFDHYLKSNPSVLNNCIIFSETKEYAIDVQRITIKSNSKFHTYYADDKKYELELFSKGVFDYLVTCKKISEGVDIKSVQNIILFSSSRAKLETIQRVGRCLRIDPNNPNKKPNVIDFVSKDDFSTETEGEYEPVDKYRYNWLKKLSEIKGE